MTVENYFSDWKQRTWVCCGCSWSGTGEGASTELFAELFELNCPQCGRRLATVALPTQDVIQSAATDGHPEAKAMLGLVARADEFQAEFQCSRQALKRLEMIAGDNLEFSLGTVDTHDSMSPSHVVLLCNGIEIYREPSGFEHWRAVIDIGGAVIDQYGDRVAWFDPAEAGVALLGDNLRASGLIQDFLDRAAVAPPSGPWATRKSGNP